MACARDNRAAVDDSDPVRAADGCDPLRDDDLRHARIFCPDGVLQQRLCLEIKRAR